MILELERKVTKVLRVALVGVGGRGRWAVQSIAADPRLEAVALVDVDIAALAAARADLDLSGSAVFSDLRMALKESDAEIAIICTPMKTHGHFCRIAFECGVHVLLEKGMTFSWEEAKELVLLADKADVRFCVAQNYRYRKEMLAISKILANPEHPENPGQLSLIDCVQHRYRPDPHTSNYPFAMVWDMSCHHMDLLLPWAGSLSRVSARTYKAPWSRYGYEPNISAFLEFEGGAMANYVLTHDALFTNLDLVLQGDSGVLRYGDNVEGVVFYPTPEKSLRSGRARECEVPEVPQDVKLVMESFLDYVEGGVEPGISGRRNLETMAACAMLVKSAMEKRCVERHEL